MLKVIIDVVSYFLLSDTWKFEWTVTDNPKLLALLQEAIKDGRITNKEVGLILKQILQEM